MTNADLPPHVQLIQMATGYWISSVLFAAAELGIVDHLAEPRTAEDLAPTLGAHAPTLHRVMRTLASIGVLTERDGLRFAVTPFGAALKTGAPGAARSTLRTLASPGFMRAFEEILYSIQTGKPGFDKAHGMPVFDFLAANPAMASLFSETMIGFHGQEPQAVAAAYDFSTFETVVDVGGATGNLLATILAKHPRTRGVLFDMPHVVGTAATELLSARGVTDRVSIATGDFFQAVPAGGDCYVLSHIIHDWSEAQCLTILGNCRRAMKPTGRLLLVEMVLPQGDAPHPGKTLDMMMLVGPGGQERTEQEYRPLLAKAGFRLLRVVPTASAVSIVETVPV